MTIHHVEPADPTPLDLLVVNGRVVTMDDERTIIEGGAVAVRDGAIVTVGPTATVRALHPGATEVIDAGGAVVCPGFVDGHQHLTGDRLIRSSIPDDLAPGESIFSWAVPVHAHHDGDDDELSATLALVEALTNGVTSVVEAGTVAHPHRVAAAVERTGARATVATWGWDVDEGPFTAPADEVLDRQRAVVERWPSSGLVRGWVALVGHDLMSDELLVGASDLARSAGTGLTFHISPHAGDAPAWVARTGHRPLVHFDRIGALGPHVLLGHAVHLDEAEREVLMSTGTALASCPWAYLRLGQGFAAAGRHARLAQAGARVALGCDSENAGDQIDVLRAAALLAGLAKDVGEDPTWFGAHEALELATLRGAEAVGLGGVVGSLTPGLRADLVVFDSRRPDWIPPGEDPALQLVWGTDGRSVRDVVVDGRIVVRDGRCTSVDLDDLAVQAAERRSGLWRRAGLDAPVRWPTV
ncbi:MAG: amidohydrolase family protein [Acidimicrobiales bacterium]